MLDTARDVKKSQTDDAMANLDGSRRAKDTIQARFNHYSNIEFMNGWEWTAMGIESAIGLGLIIESAALVGAGAAFVFPEVKLGTPTTLGATLGGANFGKVAVSFAAFMHNNSSLLKQASSMISNQGSYRRRKDDWDFQAEMAKYELGQSDAMILSWQIKYGIAMKELENHDLQRRNSQEIDDYMKSKFSNKELYDWMIGQTSTLYFQSYQMAYDLAKRAELAYRYELGISDSSFIQFGYWDSMKKGLVSGEKLVRDIKRMEVSYLELDQREYEITTSFSLAQLDPIALTQLRENSEAFFGIPEAIFDLSYPGHYFRRTRTVSITIPCIVGPYTPVNCTLSLLKSSVRTSSLLNKGAYARHENDPRFSDSYGSTQSIVTSTGQNDSGLFEVNLHDERYLPFERAGAISSWRIQMPKTYPQFDYRTMTDVIITMRYTAREGGDQMRNQVETEMSDKLLKSISLAESQNGLARMFSFRHNMPNEWYSFFGRTVPVGNTPDGPRKHQMAIDLSNARFPYVFKNKKIIINRIQLYVVVKQGVEPVHDADTIGFWLEPTPATPVTGLVLAAPERVKITVDDPSRLKLGVWHKILRTSKDFNKPAGSWTLAGSLGGVGGTSGVLSMDAIQDIYIIVGYAVQDM